MTILFWFGPNISLPTNRIGQLPVIIVTNHWLIISYTIHPKCAEKLRDMPSGTRRLNHLTWIVLVHIDTPSLRDTDICILNTKYCIRQHTLQCCVAGSHYTSNPCKDTCYHTEWQKHCTWVIWQIFKTGKNTQTFWYKLYKHYHT